MSPEKLQKLLQKQKHSPELDLSIVVSGAIRCSGACNYLFMISSAVFIEIDDRQDYYD